MSDYVQVTSQNHATEAESLHTSSSLEDLQTEEQRRVLDTVSQIRKCGLDSILSLPQLVVCGDQSAGKSSVLEALTEISFPRNDNLCTRFATEIILRRAATNSLTVKIIPDETRPTSEQQTLKAFRYHITDFGDLPDVIAKASDAMGLGATSSPDRKPRAFSRDVLSIEIEGPTRPQLTLVDIPGLIQTETKGVTKEDIDMVAQITEHYISQPRTICLAVVSASNDYANQRILTKVREVDPGGERTLGIITKPDRLPVGSGSEKAFLELARNEDIFFQLGWHILKNRTYEEGDSSFDERNQSEKVYFKKSVFHSLPADCLGIETLRKKLSMLLFEHVKRELPKLRQDLEDALADTDDELQKMGSRRSTPSECRDYLAQLSLDYYEVCKAAADGHYEGRYFNSKSSKGFSLTHLGPETIRRFRAVVQHLNTKFSDNMRHTGHKYQFDLSEQSDTAHPPDEVPSAKRSGSPNGTTPIHMSKSEAMDWIDEALTRTRGRELVGNYNPLLIGELFWEQCSHWQELAKEHVQQTSQVCRDFLDTLFLDKCPGDVRSRLWAVQIEDSLSKRDKSAFYELELLMADVGGYPINYNHYYTDTVTKRRQMRQKASLKACLKDATQHTRLDGCQSNHTSASIDIETVVDGFNYANNPSMENFSCEEALDCLIAIYKVQQKTFIANITTQVIERHIVRGIEKIFSPIVVNSFSDEQAEIIASEPASAKRQRAFLEERIGKLKHGQEVFRKAMGSSAS